jgi:hypothetical protein
MVSEHLSSRWNGARKPIGPGSDDGDTASNAGLLIRRQAPVSSTPAALGRFGEHEMEGIEGTMPPSCYHRRRDAALPDSFKPVVTPSEFAPGQKGLGVWDCCVSMR